MKQEKKRFLLTSIVGITSSILIGVLTGFVRMYWDNVILVLLGCIAIALLIQKVGKGVELKYAILGALSVLLMMIISDVIYAIGVEQLLNFGSYGRILGFEISENILVPIWLITRGLGIYIGYHYSRVI